MWILCKLFVDFIDDDKCSGKSPGLKTGLTCGVCNTLRKKAYI